MSFDPDTKISFTANAPAKINLALHVTGQRQDGYHLLDSLVCFADIGDRLTVERADRASPLVSLEIVGRYAGDLAPSSDGNNGNNLVLRAAFMLAEKLQNAGISCPPVAIILEKNLPVASGLGGGSADAAAALLLLENIWGQSGQIDLVELAAKLGSDVPMCLDSRPKRVTGTGQDIVGFALMTSLHLVLVNPNIALATSAVFDRLVDKNRQSILSDQLDQPIRSIEQAVQLLSPLGNDLQPPAIALVPQIGDVLAQIKSMPECLLTRMTGSGATCFGLFASKDAAASAITQIKEIHGDWWSVACYSIAADDNDDN